MSIASWNRLFESATEGIAGIAIQSIVVVVVIVFLIHFCLVVVVPYYRRPLNKRNEEVKYLQYLCVACFVFSLVYCLSNLVFHLIIVFVENIDCKYRSWTIFLLCMQRVCLYWNYIHRLKVTFEQSTLRERSRNLFILYTASCVTIVGATGFLYSHLECHDIAQATYIIPAFCVDIFWCLFLSIWFVGKLRRTIIEFNTPERGGDTNRKLVFLMLKLTNIIVWSSVVLQICQWVFGYLTGWIITAVSINVVTSCCALLFTFVQYSNVYMNYVCCLCHQCIVKWCAVHVEYQLVQTAQSARLQNKAQQDKVEKYDEQQQGKNANDEEDARAESPLVAKPAQEMHDNDAKAHDEQQYHD